MRVGLVWSGNPAFAGDAARSIGLRDWLRCFPCQACNSSVCTVKCVPRCPDPAKIPRGRPFRRRAHRLRRHGCRGPDLDLVIGSDTAVIHLAGALAKPSVAFDEVFARLALAARSAGQSMVPDCQTLSAAAAGGLGERRSNASDRISRSCPTRRKRGERRVGATG